MIKNDHTLHLYNSLTKGEVPFVLRQAQDDTAQDKVVTMYTCGPTVYGRPHIGNYSSFLMADLLRRWLEVGGYTVKHVKNITDVGHLLHDADTGDDKIEKQAREERVDPLAIAKKYEAMYLEDEKALNMLPMEPKNRPHATEYIKEMIEIINQLLQKGNAYETDDGIYFSVETFPKYGELSGNTLDNLNAGARIAVDETKKHPADFALWKKCVWNNNHHVLRWSFESGERSSSVGDDPLSGFPGWHIECSAMSSALLGHIIDIHTGGEDNIFPHHECEIAQSECGSGVHPFVRVWLHKRRIEIQKEGTLRQTQGDITAVMSKSLGNVLTVPDIIEAGFSALDLRYYLLSVHYRTRLKFTWKGMEDSRKARRKIVEWISEMGETGETRETKEKQDTQQHPPVLSSVEGFPGAAFEEKFAAAMNADLNTPAALAAIFDAMTHSRNHPQESCANFIEMIRHTFGCFDAEEEKIPDEIEQLKIARDSARASKNFAESDRLRGEIEGRGFTVKDTKEGQMIRKK